MKTNLVKSLIGRLVDWFRKLLMALKHNRGCIWAYQNNKNKKPFKRTCCQCGKRELRQNGEWVANGYHHNKKNRRY